MIGLLLGLALLLQCGPMPMGPSDCAPAPRVQTPAPAVVLFVEAP